MTEAKLWNALDLPPEARPRFMAVSTAPDKKIFEQAHKRGEEIRYNAMVDVLVDFVNLAEKWSENR